MGVRGGGSSEMSAKSEESSVNTMGIRGFPAKCLCGKESTIYTSKTQKNPGRPFFRCPTKKDDHLFKWVEEAVFEEVEDALPKLGCIEFELFKAKTEVETMKNDMMDLKAEVKRCKRLMKLCFGVICLIILVCVVLTILGKAKVNGNVITY